MKLGKKRKQQKAILEKLMETIMIEEVDSKGIENLSRNVESPDDAAELIRKIEHVMKSKKNNILSLGYHQGIILKNLKKIASSRVQLPSLK